MQAIAMNGKLHVGCWTCNETGQIGGRWGNETRTCPACDGQGEIVIEETDADRRNANLQDAAERWQENGRN